MKKIGSVLATALISQVVSFLNAVVQHFRGTFLAFDRWGPIVSKTAVAIGFVIIIVIAAWASSTAQPVLLKRARDSLVATLVLFALCIGMYFLIDSGYAPTTEYLYITRDVMWPLLYLFMLIMASITIALAQLALFPIRTGGGSARSRRRSTKTERD
jgi:hypothetical protein